MHLSIFLCLMASGKFIWFLLQLQRNKMLQVDLNENINALESCLCRIRCHFCNTCIYFFIQGISPTNTSLFSMFNINLKGYSTWIFVFAHDSCFCYYLEISLYIISFKLLSVRVRCIILKEQAHRASRFCQCVAISFMSNVFNIKSLLQYFNVLKFYCMTQ